MGKREDLAQLIDTLWELSPKAGGALVWLIENIELVDMMIEVEPITKQKIEQHISDAIRKKDYLFSILSCYAKIKCGYDKEESILDHSGDSHND